MTPRNLAALGILALAGLAWGLAPAGPAGAETTISFKDDVAPILKLYCVSCHQPPDGEGFKASGLDLTSYEGVMKGTKYGPMIAPGHPEYSNLIWLLDWRANAELRMPHGKNQLPNGERDIIRGWIHQGANNN